MNTFLDSGKSTLEKLYRGITNPVRLLPDFIIIGTQRGGTTSLYNYLTECPNIGGAYTKEVHFFDKSYEKGLSWYRAQFPSAVQKYYLEQVHKQVFITGEASPYYLFHPHVPKRIARVMPDVKLIVLLRNPVDRAYSHYYHEVDCGYESLSFEEAIETEEERTNKEQEKMAKDEHYTSYSHQHHTYLARGIYINQLQAWMSVFPIEQFLILKSEDFYADPEEGLQRTLSFLNLGDGKSVGQRKLQFKKYNDTKSPQMDLTTRQRLLDYFEPHNARLYEFLGQDFGWDK